MQIEISEKRWCNSITNSRVSNQWNWNRAFYLSATLCKRYKRKCDNSYYGEMISDSWIINRVPRRYDFPATLLNKANVILIRGKFIKWNLESMSYGHNTLSGKPIMLM